MRRMFRGNREYREAVQQFRNSTQGFVRKFTRAEKRAIEAEINPVEELTVLTFSGMHEFYDGIVFGDWLLIKAVRYYAPQVADQYKQLGDFEKASDITNALHEYFEEFPDTAP